MKIKFVTKILLTQLIFMFLSVGCFGMNYTQTKIGVIPYTDDGFILLGQDSRSAVQHSESATHLGWSMFSGVAFSKNLQHDAMQIFYDKSRYAYWNRATNAYALSEKDFSYYVKSVTVTNNRNTGNRNVYSDIYIFFVRVPYRVDEQEIASHQIICNAQDQVVNWTWVHVSSLLLGGRGNACPQIRNSKGAPITLFIAFIKNLQDANVQANLLSIAANHTVDFTKILRYEAPKSDSILIPWDQFSEGGVTALNRYLGLDNLTFINVGFLFYNSSGNCLLRRDLSRGSYSPLRPHAGTALNCSNWSVLSAGFVIRDLASQPSQNWHTFFCDRINDVIRGANHRITDVIIVKDTPFILCCVYLPNSNGLSFEIGASEFKWVFGESLIDAFYSADCLQGFKLRLFSGFADAISSHASQAYLRFSMNVVRYRS